MAKRELSREELFGLVWERPTSEIAKDLGISDVAVGKLCDPNSLGCASRIKEVRKTFPFQSIFPPDRYQILGLPTRPDRNLQASDSDCNFVQSGIYCRPFRNLVGTSQLSRTVSGGVLK